MSKKVLGNVYKRFDVRVAVIRDDKVYEVNANNFEHWHRQAFRSVSKIQAGMFGPLVSKLSKQGLFYVVTKLKPKTVGKEIGSIDQFDGVSLSSINRPYSKLVKSKLDKASIERWVNPFALITDGVRNIHTFLYQMPVVRLSHRLLNMFHKSKLAITGFGHEMFGIPGVTVFIDKDSEKTFELLRSLTDMPLSLEGDGFVVSEKWVDEIKVVTDLYEEMDLPCTFKMQGAARSKGIVIGKFADKVTVEALGHEFDVDVIMNTQIKRKNKAANVTAAGMRLRKFVGENIEIIDTGNVQQLIAMKQKYGYLSGTLKVNGVAVGTVIVGINKYYIDLTHRFEPRIARSNVTYVQAKQILDVIDYPLFDRFSYRKNRVEETVIVSDKQLNVLNSLLGQFSSIDQEETVDPMLAG